MHRATTLTAFTFALAYLFTADVRAQETHGDHAMFNPDDLEWRDGPASIQPGAQMAILEGVPSEEGPFTLRLRLPANYVIAPHHHPAIEHVTVIDGVFHMGLGETLDPEAAHALEPGGFAVMQIGTRHFAFTGTEPATVQLHGIGPWDIIYVNPEDDPRNASE